MNKAVVNEDATTRLIRELREEILALRAELTAVKSVGAGAGGGGSVPAGPPLSPAEAAAAEATRAAELESKRRRASAIAEMRSSISEAAAEDDGAAPATVLEAATKGDAAALQKLIDGGADCNEADEEERYVCAFLQKRSAKIRERERGAKKKNAKNKKN